MEHYKKALEEGMDGFEEKFVFIPPPENHESGGTLLRPYEITGSVGDVKRFILQFAEKIRQAVVEDDVEWAEEKKKADDFLVNEDVKKDEIFYAIAKSSVGGYNQALTEIITHKREQLTKE